MIRVGNGANMHREAREAEPDAARVRQLLMGFRTSRGRRPGTDRAGPSRALPSGRIASHSDHSDTIVSQPDRRRARELM